MRVKLPALTSLCQILATTAPFLPPPILLFEAALSNLWSIWECLVLCEPILVFGSSPAQTSQAVWWLRDLLRPVSPCFTSVFSKPLIFSSPFGSQIPLAGDIRPYFTMQDSDHLQLVNKLPPKAGLLLGVTNPFFEKSCTHWPHVLSLGRRAQYVLHSLRLFSVPDSFYCRTLNSSRQRSPTLGAPAGPPPGWKTQTHKRYISKDRVLLKQLENAVRGDDKARMLFLFVVCAFYSSRTLVGRHGRFYGTPKALLFSFDAAHYAARAIPQYAYTLSFGSPSCQESIIHLALFLIIIFVPFTCTVAVACFLE